MVSTFLLAAAGCLLLAVGQWRRQGMGYGSRGSLVPAPTTVKHILVKNQKVNCAQFSNSDRFLQSKSVNNVCKLLQLMRFFIPQIPYRGFASGPHRGTPDPLVYSPQMKIPGAPLFVGAIAQGVWGTDVPRWSPGGLGDELPPEAEAVCRHCLQILTAKTIKTGKFRTIHLLILDQ